MNFTEQASLFGCAGETLVGILALPAAPLDTGVVIIVGGPQYRAGSHRQFVLLSRALATAGYAVLRFDYRGMGDSTGELLNFESVNPDIACAIDVLQAAIPGLRNVVLWGLCDGASAALLYCHAVQDSRIRGLCLLNPWVRSTASLAKTHVKHYYLQRLRQREFWVKLLSGRVAGRALCGLVKSIKLARSSQDKQDTQPTGALPPFQNRMGMAWKSFDGAILLLLSGDDYTAKEFQEHVASSPAWADAMQKRTLIRHHEPGADHTLSELRFNAVVEKCTLDMLVPLILHPHKTREIPK